jgi:peptide/nickel transport system substrate-binding protein
MQRVSRRYFMVGGSTMALGLLAACAAPAAAPAKPTEAPKPVATAQPASAAVPSTAASPAAAAPAASPAAAAPAASPAAKSPAVGTSSKDSMVLAQTQDAVSMDPPMHSLIQNNTILMHMFDSLVYLDGQSKLQPMLATTWESTSPTTWAFRIRPGVKFHNGEPCDAAAIKFSLDRALNPDQKSPTRSKIAAISKVEAPDPGTLIITTAQPFALLPYTLIGFGAMPIPPKYAKDKGDPELAKTPVGSGPYKFVEWVKDDHITLEANPDYWGEKPKIKRVTIRPIPENATRVAELRSGGVDLIINPPPQEMAALGAGDTKTYVQPSLWAITLGIDALRPGPLQDKRVRQALNYAIDKEALIKGVLGGLGKPINSLAVPEVFGYDASLPVYPYDPAKARSLLAEAGAAGMPLVLTTRVNNTLNDKDASEAIVGYLKAVGLDASLRTMENGVWAQWSNNKGREGIWYAGWRGDYPEVDGYAYSNLVSGQFQGYLKDDELDKVVQQARETIDSTKRADLYRQVGKLSNDLATHVFLYQLPDTYAARKNLNWQAKPDSVVELWGASFS